MQASAALAERVRREELCAVTASSCRRLLLSLRLPRLARPPAQSAALGPAEPGRLSGRRRLSATLERAAAPADQGQAGLPGPRSARCRRLLPIVAGTLRPRRPGRNSPPLPPRGEGAEKAERLLQEGASRGPCPRGSGLEAEAEGSARHSLEESFTSRRRLRLRLPVA